MQSKDSFAATGRLLVIRLQKRLAAVVVLAVSLAVAAENAGIHWERIHK
jgi:hypothetical protein